MIALPRVPLALKRALKIASDVIPKLPASGDPLATKLVKVLGIIDSVTGTQDRGEDPFTFLRSLAGFTSTTNPFFADLFFATPLASYFKVEHISMGEGCALVRAHRDGLGEVYFVQWTWNGPPITDRSFWHTEGFDFDACLALLWESYGDHILLGTEVDRAFHTRRLTCAANSLPRDPLLGRARGRLERMVAKHRLYHRDSIPRTYLLLGSWGTGKTTFALRMAQELGGRSLTLDANGFTALSTADLDLILSGLAPQALIIDDLDRAAELGAILPTLFVTLKALRASHPGVAIFITANLVERIDPALNRPERIDEVELFELPDDDERERILRGYLQADANEAPADADVALLVGATCGLSEVFIKEVALQLRYEEPREIAERVERRKKLTAPAGASASPPPETKPEPPPTI